MASKRSGGVYSNATREGLDWSPMTCDLAPDIPAWMKLIGISTQGISACGVPLRRIVDESILLYAYIEYLLYQEYLK